MKRENRKLSQWYVTGMMRTVMLLAMGLVMVSQGGNRVRAVSKTALNVSKKTLCISRSFQLKLNGTSKKVRWKSNNRAVATVNSAGKVAAKSAGTAVVTAQKGKKMYKCKITVKDHEFAKATCSNPKTCTICGLTKGTALSHSYKAATCTTPRTCKKCGVTEGAALGHDYKNATCTEARTCTRCYMTEGEALGHDYGTATCTKPGKCSRCGQTQDSALGHTYVDTVVEASKEAMGYTQHVCSRCGQSYTDTYTDFQPNATQVYADMMALQSSYPTGTPWSNSKGYRSNTLGLGYGCAGFAYMLSDAAFGYLPGRKHTDFTNIKVGDVLRIYNDGHSLIVLQIAGTKVVLADGMYNGAICWERTMTLAELKECGTYVLTRYPQ